jgi:hypothetical protein
MVASQVFKGKVGGQGEVRTAPKGPWTTLGPWRL